MRIVTALVLLLGLVGAGCTDMAPLDRSALGISSPDELPAGRGLFSGDEGAFTYGAEL